MNRRMLAAAGASAAIAAAAAWWYADSVPYPYAQHRILDLPLPFLTSRRLDALLAIRLGERALEIGPGTGLEHVMHRARAAGITSITAARSQTQPRQSASCGASSSHPGGSSSGSSSTATTYPW